MFPGLSRGNINILDRILWKKIHHLKKYHIRFIYKIIDTYTKLLIKYPHIYIFDYQRKFHSGNSELRTFTFSLAQRSLRAVGISADSSCNNFLISPKMIALNWHVPKIEKEVAQEIIESSWYVLEVEEEFKRFRGRVEVEKSM